MFSTGQLARDIGTVLVGKDAVEVGLIDEAAGLGRAIAVLNELIEKRRSGGEPVSYTHLDVYKRQEHQFPELRLGDM